MFFLFFKKNNKEKTLKVIFYYILYCILNEFISLYLHKIGVKIENILFSVFTILEFSFFCLFYYYVLPTTFVRRSVAKIWGLFLVFACIDFFIIENQNAFDSLAVGVEYILIILMCIYYLIVQIRGTYSLTVYSTSNFWIIITFLIYTSGTFFLYIMAGKMFNDRNFHFQYTIINSSFDILKNILFSIAMLMKSTPTNVSGRNNNNMDELFSYKLKT